MKNKKLLFAALFLAALAFGFVGCENPGDLLNNGDDSSITDNDSTTNNPNQGDNSSNGDESERPIPDISSTLVATGAATDVGHSMVTLWGRLNTDSLPMIGNVTGWGIEYAYNRESVESHKHSETTKVKCTTELQGENADEFSIECAELTGGVTIYYSAYAMVDMKYIYGEVDSVHLDVKLTVNSNNSSYGTVTGSGTYDHLAEATITATPKENYYFAGWSDCDSKELTRTITLTSDSTITANFAKKPYLTVNVNRDINWGKVSGSGYYMPGDEVTITATPNSGAYFVKWNDGNTDNPRTVVVTSDTTFTANFDVAAVVANAAFGTAYTMYKCTDLFLATETDTLVISLNTEGEETLTVGEYTMDDSGSYPPGTWDPEYSMLRNVARLSDGTVSVTKAGSNYNIKAECIDENGDPVKWVYTGQVDLEVKAHEPAQPEFNLTWDNFDTDYTYYMYVNQYSLYAYALAIVDPETGWELDLQFTATGTDTEGKLPTGTFTMLTSSITEYGILPGYIDDDGYTNGSYAINWEDPSFTFNPFVDGSFTITEADGNTTLEGSFTTESGDEVVVNVTGATPTIELYNPNGVPAKKSIVAKQGRTISKRFMK